MNRGLERDPGKQASGFGRDPRAWLADVLRRIADHPALLLDELLPWNCVEQADKLAA